MTAIFILCRVRDSGGSRGGRDRGGATAGDGKSGDGKKDGSAVRHTTPPALNAYGKKYKGIEK